MNGGCESTLISCPLTVSALFIDLLTELDNMRGGHYRVMILERVRSKVAKFVAKFVRIDKSKLQTRLHLSGDQYTPSSSLTRRRINDRIWRRH